MGRLHGVQQGTPALATSGPPERRHSPLATERCGSLMRVAAERGHAGSARANSLRLSSKAPVSNAERGNATAGPNLAE
jgi:hypothetical protein